MSKQSGFNIEWKKQQFQIDIISPTISWQYEARTCMAMPTVIFIWQITITQMSQLFYTLEIILDMFRLGFVELLVLLLFCFSNRLKYTFFMMAFFRLCSFNSGIFARKRNYYFRFALCAILWNVIRRINTLTYPMSAHATNVVTCKFDSCISYFGRWIYVR